MKNDTEQATMKKVLTYDDKVIKKIAGIATEGVKGIFTVSSGLIGSITDRLRTDDETKGIGVEVGTKQVALDINVLCEYGQHVPELFDQVADKVIGAIREMTGLEVVEIDMHVEDILNHTDFESTRQKMTAPHGEAGGKANVPQPQAQEIRAH